MALIGYDFDATQVEPSAPMEPVPPGEYVAQIKNSEMKPTKSGSGEYLKLDIEVVEGEYKGRMFFDRLNLQNANQTAVEIANKTLSAICHAIGVLKVRDSSQLHYRKMIVRVDVEKRDGYAAQNVVKAYLPVEGGHAHGGSTSGGHTQGGSATQGGAPVTKAPWQR